MLIVRNIGYRSAMPTAVALGTFDGVHVGHRAVIGEAVSLSRREGLLSAVFTFSSLPKNAFLPKEKQVLPLCPFEKKASLIASLGVDILEAPEFTRELSLMLPEEFVSGILIGRLNARRIVCGEDHRFGAGGRGDAALLKAICRENGVALTVVPPVMKDGVRVSSTLIRELIAQGRKEEAEGMLGVRH